MAMQVELERSPETRLFFVGLWNSIVIGRQTLFWYDTDKDLF